jgi:uncharacterized protein (TIGR00375 family)
MSIKEIARYAKIKGLQLVGTGDFTHPDWLKEIQADLSPDADTGLYKLTSNPAFPVSFMLTTEVCTIFNYENDSKKIHHVILSPSLDQVVQINEKLRRYGSLSADGRPLLNMTAPQLVEEVMQVSKENLIFPAHAWTPWFSVFGAFSGFDSIEDCYQDTTKHIHAMETGLSSDPPMNWRLSKLDKFTLLSNSDSHSFWPWRMGREANVFDLERPSYKEITDAICTKDKKRFKYTIETDPAYGKYHWTGHRSCNVSLSPQEARKLGNICSVCKRKLTEGVEQRVEDLADRPDGFKDRTSPGYMRLLPLSEIIAAVLNVDSPSTRAVWTEYNSLLEKFGDEYAVLIDATNEEISSIVEPSIGNAIIGVREGRVKVTPGYDGVYGKITLGGKTDIPKPKQPSGDIKQSNLADFW